MTAGKESTCNAGDARDVGDAGSIPGWGRSPGGGNGDPLQCSCLENPMHRGALQATVQRNTKNRHCTGYVDRDSENVRLYLRPSFDFQAGPNICSSRRQDLAPVLLSWGTGGWARLAWAPSLPLKAPPGRPSRAPAGPPARLLASTPVFSRYRTRQVQQEPHGHK